MSTNGLAANQNGQAALDAALKKDADKGAAVHSFDPEASPAQKGAAAGKARDQLKSVKASSGPNVERGLYSLVSDPFATRVTF